jgi:hypothetical protein
MIHIHNNKTGWWVILLTVTAWTISNSSSAQPPRPGEVQRVTVVSVLLQAGSTEKETRQVTYTPPPGWYVRSHQVDCTRKTGNSSFAVSTVPQDWNWSLEEKVVESYRSLINLAARSGNTGLKAKFKLEREQTLAEIRKVRSTHHALIVDATAKGEGFLRGGGTLELTVMAELVFVGNEESLARTIAQHKATLSKTPVKPSSSSKREH